MGFSPLRNDFSTPLVVLMCMVGLVLLIACANVANLLIARGFMRQREIAVRLSLGASRGRLVSQLLVESLVLSCAGGVVGLGLAFVLTRGLLTLIPQDGQPLLIRPEPDVRILAFTMALTFLTGIVFGLLPALRASRPDPWSTLKDTMGSIAGTGGSLFLRKGLVTAQVALSFLLLFGAGLFVRSLQNLQGTETGVALDNLITFQLSPALSGYDNQRASQFYESLLERLNSAPGVTSAGIAAVSILSGDEWDSSMSVEGHRPADGEDMQAFMNALSAGYFKTMKIPILEGRDFTRLDFKERPTVAIVNKRFAEHFFKGTSAVGKHIGQGVGPQTKLTIEIIGVVADSLYEGPREGVHAPGVHSQVRKRQRGSLRAHDHALFGGVQPGAERGAPAGCGDAGLQPEDARGAARRDPADRPPHCAALGRLRPARDRPRVDWPLRRDGVRRRQAQEGARDPPRTRRAARRSSSGW